MINRQIGKPIIPTTIIVHLGKPEEAAEDIHISFIDYIKNVACNEIYPSWPEEAIRSNILAQISFALNRIYTEWYRSNNYQFDITSLPAYDQTFKKGRDLFENISKIVDEIFNNYIVKGNHIEPFFAKYCDGKNTICDGLSQWGTVELAKKGMTPTDILRHYYGKDISIIRDAEVAAPISSYIGIPLKLGDVGEHIRIIKRQLNRIAVNYPTIPTFDVIHEYFDIVLESAIKKFQDIFDLNITGIIDKATWYKIKYLYTAVKKLSDLYAEGITVEEIEAKYDLELKEKDEGDHVRALHYFLGVIAYFDSKVPLLDINSLYDANTKKMVIAFQNEYNLKANGIVDIITWNKIKEVYFNIIKNLPEDVFKYKDEIYPGKSLSLGMTGSDILTLQQFLKEINIKDPNVVKVDIIGCFDTKTENAVKQLQKEAGLEENGHVGPLEWQYIVEKSKL